MSRTTFSGPVKSDNGFEGAIIGNVTATTGTSTFNNLETTGNTGIGNAGTDTIGFYGATKIARPTTAVAAAAFVANTSGIVDDTATFDGYTVGQVVKALRNLGLLA
jgi:plasmid replication initiation protein